MVHVVEGIVLHGTSREVVAEHYGLLHLVALRKGDAVDCFRKRYSIHCSKFFENVGAESGVGKRNRAEIGLLVAVDDKVVVGRSTDDFL